MEAFLQGVVAGYGVAIPVGAIAMLIIDTGIRRGLPSALGAGAGAALADLFYAVLALVAGSAIAAALAPWAGPLRWASALVLIALGLWGLRGIRRGSDLPAAQAATGGRGEVARETFRTFGKFLGLTLINPMTVVYFTALILGMRLGAGSWGAGLLFALGAFLSSLSWQWLLAGIGALAGRGLPPRFRIAASVFGNLVVIALGLAILLRPQP